MCRAQQIQQHLMDRHLTKYRAVQFFIGDHALNGCGWNFLQRDQLLQHSAGAALRQVDADRLTGIMIAQISVKQRTQPFAGSLLADDDDLCMREVETPRMSPGSPC